MESGPVLAVQCRTMNQAMPMAHERSYWWCWWGAGLGLATGLFDAWLMDSLGIDFRSHGRNMLWMVGAYFGLSFAGLGYLLGVVAAGRRRDHASAQIIQQQLNDLQQLRGRLAQGEKLAALGQLAAAIAHEVRTPLAVMRSASQSVVEAVGDTNADARQSCAFMITEIDRLTNVVSSLLTFVRPLTLRRQPARLEEMLARTLQLAASDPATVMVRLQQHADTNLPEVDVDPDLFCQALLGLLANATQAAGPGGEVSLSAVARGDSVEVAIEDSGPGVPADLSERIFEPFFTTRPHGTGLGLAVVRQIIEAHGGRIDVAGRRGGGARFAIRLPLGAAS